MTDEPQPRDRRGRNRQTMEFRAEVQQLLNILAHSLYTEREIFLRELISNASDALHRIQFEMLTNRDVLDRDAELAIRIESDPEAHTLTISDTGIGMTHDELIENLGTIAHSGAMAFLQKIGEGPEAVDIIGQFGVGFYSVFMVADEVVVTTRSYRPDAEAWRWTSRGDSRFTLEPADKQTRGTEVFIKLKEDAQRLRDRLAAGEHHPPPFELRLVPDLREGRGRQPADRAVAHADQRRQARGVRRVLPPADARRRSRRSLHTHIVTDAPVEIRASSTCRASWTAASSASARTTACGSTRARC